MVGLLRCSLDNESGYSALGNGNNASLLWGKSIELDHLDWKTPTLHSLNGETEVLRGKVIHDRSKVSGLQSSGPSTTAEASTGRKFQA